MSENSQAIPTDSAATHYRLVAMNWQRLPLLFLLILPVELYLILFFDLPNQQVTQGPLAVAYRMYLVLHILVAIHASVIIVLGWQFRRGWRPSPRLLEGISAVSLGSYLIMVALIGVLDHWRINQDNVYFANLLIGSTIVLLRFGPSFVVLTLSAVVFSLGLVVVQAHGPGVFATVVNGGVFYIVALFIMKTFYDTQFRLLSTQSRLEYLSAHDPLTGLLNRHQFSEIFGTQVPLLRRQGAQACLVLLDLDHFKVLNDRYGHGTGDLVLQATARALKAHLRESDAVARWGGEEFLLFLPDTGVAEAEALAERLRSTLATMLVEGPQGPLTFSASFGVAPLNLELADPFLPAFTSADGALYRAKAGGRNRVERG